MKGIFFLENLDVDSTDVECPGSIQVINLTTAFGVESLFLIGNNLLDPTLKSPVQYLN